MADPEHAPPPPDVKFGEDNVTEGAATTEATMRQQK